MTNKIQTKVIVTGRVQGVFYRAETQKAANKLKVKGYVKNLANGSVKAVFEGEKKAVAQMVQWCHKGSPGSMVDHVKAEDLKVLSDFKTFEIRYQV